ncbi:hypothetical protein F4819DRAFT_501579 [Hypoxylon fuscum]|nr:hypothetical protein F4819DRAFT_501579 [Hypoxylon fuscum]
MTRCFVVLLEFLYHLDLPYPATKVTIGQYFWVHPTRHSWACLIVGSFYDSSDRELWHVELFLGCRDITASEPTELSIVDTPETPMISDNNYYGNDHTNIELQFSNIHTYFHTYHTFANWSSPSAMASQGFGNGWNPQFGMDPRANAGRPFGNAMPGGGALPGSGGPSYVVNRGPLNFPGTPASGPIPGPNNQSPAYVIPQNGYNHPVPVFPNQPTRLPNPHPVVNPDAPALNLNNSTGGVGCEPGYNYFFPPEHTKLHVIKSSTAPWRLPEGMSMNFGAYHVPVNTTLSELLVGFGAVNPLPKKNKITEVIQGGNGKWYRGVTFSGDKLDAIKKTLRDLGWDSTRTGRPGEKPVIWLWITKD